MMQCQICGDQNGPWEYADQIKNMRIILVCEDCAKKIRKENKKICGKCDNKNKLSSLCYECERR